MKQNLKNKLRELYNTAPQKPDAGNKATLITLARNKRLALPTETSLFWFIKSQIHFVNKSFLACQFLLLCFYGFFTTVVLKDNDGFLLLVPLVPIVVMFSTSEISRSFRFNMAEMELPSRFSLPQILLARFVIAAVIDILSLTCMLILTAMKTYYTFGALVLYGLVPGFLAAAGSLFLQNRSRSVNSQYYVSAYCVSLSVFGAISIEAWPTWYDSAAVTVWLVILIISASVFIVELNKMFQDSRKQLGYGGAN